MRFVIFPLFLCSAVFASESPHDSASTSKSPTSSEKQENSESEPQFYVRPLFCLSRSQAGINHAPPPKEPVVAVARSSPSSEETLIAIIRKAKSQSVRNPAHKAMTPFPSSSPTFPKRRERSASAVIPRSTEREFIQVHNTTEESTNPDLKMRKRAKKNSDLRIMVLRKIQVPGAKAKTLSPKEIQQLLDEAQVIANGFLIENRNRRLLKDSMIFIRTKCKSVEAVSALAKDDFIKLLAFALLTDVREIAGPINAGKRNPENRIRPMFGSSKEKCIYLNSLRARLRNLQKKTTFLHSMNF